MNNKRLPIVYVAGAYSADNVMDVLRNIRKGIQLGERVLATGEAAPFIPWLDWQLEMFDDHDKDTYYRYSMAFLEKSDAVMLRWEGHEKSAGMQAELARAHELGLTIFDDRDWEAFRLWLKTPR